MFASTLRLSPYGLRETAELLLIWSVKNVRKLEYGKRPYSILKKTSFPKVNTLFGKNNIQCSYIKRSCGTVKSAVYNSSDLGGNRSTEIQEFLRKHSITVEGNNPAAPLFNVEDAGFSDDILSVLRKCNISEPTPIQALSWSNGLHGRDFVGISKTGSGKTLAYIIPAVIHIQKLKAKKYNRSPLALVLVPTRELALQVENVAKLFVNESLKCVCLYGGASKQPQFRKIQNGVDLCIATPGRILDFINMGILSLRECSFLVLDEADRMLDMGFLPDLEKIVNAIECKKQVLMWSATWPKEVKNIAERFLSDYILNAVGSTQLKPNPNVRQIVKVVNSTEKNQVLLNLLEDIHSDESCSKILIFVETKFGVDALQYFLHTNKVRAAAIHSGKTQRTREITMHDFRSGRCQVLIATAVAARGLDVDNITHVINYDCPKFFEEYIHKIGRTARHDKTGTSITFVTPADTFSGYLLDVMKKSNEAIPKELYSIAQTQQLSFNAINPNRKHKGYPRSPHRNKFY